MSGVLLAIVLMLTSIGLPAYGDNAPIVGTRDLRITDALGQVTIEPAENPKVPCPIDEDTPLQENDVVVTGPKSRAELTMDGETIFKVEPDSRFKVLKIFPNNTQFEVAQGGLVAKVKPVEREDDAIIIKLPTAVVAIRGTEFAADTGNGVAHVGVFDEGHVAVAGAWGHEHVLLEPNHETEVPLTSVPKPPQPVSHFKTWHAQMPQIRSRVNYWHQHWEPIGPDQRKQIRQRISSGVHFPSQTGFRHSAITAPAVKAKPKRAPTKHHPTHSHKHKPVHHTPAKKTVHHHAAHTTHKTVHHKTVHHAAAHHATPARRKTQPTQN